METKFTKGPWLVSESQDEVSVVMGSAIDSPYEYTCGHVWQSEGVYWSEADEEDIANAHLIAAAPCLYSALQDMVDDYDRWLLIDGNNPDETVEPLYQAARAALAKARGEDHA